MKLTMTHYDKTYTIECKADDLTLSDVRDELLIPLLLAAGFHHEVVREMFFDEETADADKVEPEI